MTYSILRALSHITAITFFTALFPTLLGANGHFENGGGGVMICKDTPNAGVEKIFLLDLWEAEKLQGLTIFRSWSPGTIDQIETEVLRLLNNPNLNEELRRSLTWEVEGLLSQIRSGKTRLPSDLSIAPPLDGGNGFSGRSCVMRGVALYDHVRGRLFLEQTLFDQMPLTDQAALVLHEAVYIKFRQWYFAENSIGTRRVVGCLVSRDCKDLQPIPIPVDSDRMLSCIAIKSSYAQQGKFLPSLEFLLKIKDGVEFLLNRYNGKPVATKTSNSGLVSTFSIDRKRPTLIGGKTYYPVFGNTRMDIPMLLKAEHGQSISIRWGTLETPEGSQQHLDGAPIYCQ